MPHELTLLCLDDQQTGLFIRKLVLETEGFRVFTATNAQNALEQMSEHYVDLVIADHLLRCLLPCGHVLYVGSRQRISANSPRAAFDVLNRN